MEPRDTFHDREADTHAFVFCISCFVYAIKFLFHVCEFIVRDADSIIRKRDYIFMRSFRIAHGQSSIFSGILREIRKHVMEDLDIHIFIHAREGIRWHVESDTLIDFLELWNIFRDDLFGYLS